MGTIRLSLENTEMLSVGNKVSISLTSQLLPEIVRSQEYEKSQNVVVVSNVPPATYGIILKLIAQDGKIEADGVINEVIVNPDSETNRKMSLTLKNSGDQDPWKWKILSGYDRASNAGSCKVPEDDGLSVVCSFNPSYGDAFREQCQKAGFQKVGCPCHELCSGRFEFVIPPVKEGSRRGFTDSHRGEFSDCPNELIHASLPEECSLTLSKVQISNEKFYEDKCKKSGFESFSCKCKILCSSSPEVITW